MKTGKLIVLTYCARTKTALKHGTPESLYSSQRIKSFFKRFPGPKAILSYKFGIIPENAIIPNYEQSSFGKNYLKLVLRVKKFLEAYERIVFYSPRELVEIPWIKLLNDSGIEYEIVRSYKDFSL